MICTGISEGGLSIRALFTSKCSILLLLLACMGCSKNVVSEDCAPFFSVTVEAQNAGDLSKTTIADKVLEWKESDAIGLFVGKGYQNNCKFDYQETGVFAGEFRRGLENLDEVDYFSYYPYSKQYSDGVIVGNLSISQAAPFDAKNDYVVSDVLTQRYDERDMPFIELVFQNHLFSIVKFTFTNTNPELKDEILSHTVISSPEGFRYGQFKFDPSLGKDANPIFDKSDRDDINVNFPLEASSTLGLCVPHSFYVVVASGSYSGISVMVSTKNYKFSVTTDKETILLRNNVTYMPVIDLGTAHKEKKTIKTLAYWGDSVASSALCNSIQELLGDSWIVYRGGVPGNSCLGIVGLNGAIPLCIKEEITLPKSASEKVQISGIYSSLNMQNVGSSYWFQSSSSSQLNPCTICNIPCTISYVSGKYYLQRLYDGESSNILPAKSFIVSYGATALRNCDVVACYMGLNGRPSDANLVSYYNAMKEYVYTDNFIACGFHRRPFGATTYWTESYCNLFRATFGDKYLDYKTYGNENADRLLISSGTYTSLEQKTEEDIALIEEGEWPAAWYKDFETNVHPVNNGYKAMALMVYEKMIDLGFLDE